MHPLYKPDVCRFTLQIKNWVARRCLGDVWANVAYNLQSELHKMDPFYN